MGEGINKVVHHEWHGLINLIFGLAFIGVVVFAFLFFSTYLKNATGK
jgi:hypothetical protein